MTQVRVKIEAVEFGQIVRESPRDEFLDTTGARRAHSAEADSPERGVDVLKR